MKNKTPIHTTPDGAFQYGWIASPKDMCGTMTPFRQCWNVQALSDGNMAFVTTRKDVFEFIAEVYDICDNIYPAWLAKEVGRKRGLP